MSGRIEGILSPDRMYRLKYLQSQFGFSRKTINAINRSGVIPRLVGREHWYIGEDLIEWIKTCRKDPAGD